jgi:glutaminyl-tRNA synthetase
LFTDESPDSHKVKNFLEFKNTNSLQIVKAFLEPSLTTVSSGEKFQFQRMGYFNVDNDSKEGKLVFNKTVGLKDAWEEKGKKEANLLMNTQKEINKYVKGKQASDADLLLKTIVDNIQSIDNFSLINQTLVKNVKNDNNSLLFANLILANSNKVQTKDIELDILTKLYSMSLKSQLASVRILAIENLKKDSINFKDFKNQLLELKITEKNENALDLLNALSI